MIATRWALVAAMRPIPRSVSSGRSPGGADDRGDRRRPSRGASGDGRGDVEDRFRAGLVVREVDDDGPLPQPEQVHASRRQLRRRTEVAQAVGDLGDRHPHRAGTAGGGQGVGDVVAGEAAERHGQVGGGGDLVLLVAVPLDEEPAAEHVGAPAGASVAGDEGRRVGVHGEPGDPGADAAGDGGDEAVVGVQDDPAVGLRDPADRRLDLGELGEGVDALEIEVVRGHVGEHARLVGLVAHPAQDEAAARGLEDGDVDVVPAEDDLGATRARPVAGVDHPLVDQDAVRRRRPDVAPGPQQDVGDEAGHRRLAVGAGDRDGGDAARVVADPRGRGGARLREACLPAGERLGLGPGEARTPRGGDAAGREVEGRLGDQAGALGAGPRPGHDPVAGVGAAMDLARSTVLAVVGAKTAGPGDEVFDRIGPLARRHLAPEVDDAVARGPRSLPGLRAPDGDLDLDHRHEPVDVGSLEESDLDQPHGPARIREGEAGAGLFRPGMARRSRRLRRKTATREARR